MIGRNFVRDITFVAKALWPGYRRYKKCRYIGYTGYGNLGDEAVKEATLALFHDKWLFCDSYGRFVRGLESLGLLKFDAAMLGGGTLVLRSQHVLDQLRAPGFKKRVVFGTGVSQRVFFNDFPERYGRLAEWREVLEVADYIGVRGPLSKRKLEENGVNRVNVLGDPALYFTRPISRRKLKTKRLGINIGAAGQGTHGALLWGRDEQSFLRRFTELVKLMVDSGWEVEAVPVSAEDFEVTRRLLRLAGLEKRVRIFRGYGSLSRTLAKLETFDVFIGEKLHSVILSYCVNTPAVMVEYRPKCRDFMQSIGMERFVLRTDEFSTESAERLIWELYADLDQQREAANAACMHYKEMLIAESRTVSKIMDSDAESPRRKNNTVTLSLIIPTMNRPTDLECALESVFKQTRVPQEVIVVDQSESDDTKKTVEQLGLQYAGRGTVIRYIYQNEKSTVKARNRGIDLASGRIVGFIDDDVVLFPDYFERVLQYFEKDPKIGGVMGNVVMERPLFSGWKWQIRKILMRLFLVSNFDAKLTATGFGYPIFDREVHRPMAVELMCGYSMNFRREYLMQCRFDEWFTGYSYREDVDLSYRISQKTRLLVVPEARFYHKSSSINRLDEGALKKMQIKNSYYVFRKYKYRNVFSNFLFAYSFCGLLFMDFIEVLTSLNREKFMKFKIGLRSLFDLCLNKRNFSY